MVEIIDISVFGATGDQNADVEKTLKKSILETSTHERNYIFNRNKNAFLGLEIGVVDKPRRAGGVPPPASTTQSTNFDWRLM